jgi:hypothetical protein
MLIFRIGFVICSIVLETYYSPDGNTCLRLCLLQQELAIHTFTIATAITLDNITDSFHNSADFIANQIIFIHLLYHDIRNAFRRHEFNTQRIRAAQLQNAQSQDRTRLQHARASSQNRGQPVPPPRNQRQRPRTHLLRIHMKPGAKVIDYTTEFRTYAPVSRLRDNALALLYCHGLPERIQRELDREENLHTLAQVQKAAAYLDWAYWASRERRERDEGRGGGSRTSGGQQQQARPQGTSELRHNKWTV